MLFPYNLTASQFRVKQWPRNCQPLKCIKILPRIQYLYLIPTPYYIVHGQSSVCLGKPSPAVGSLIFRTGVSEINSTWRACIFGRQSPVESVTS